MNRERNPERIGRDGFLRLQFERRGPRTVLGKSRFTLPLQVLTPLTLDNGTAYLMLLNPTGGVLGGDHLVTEIIQEPETHVCLTTPSATRIYRTLDRPAILETTIRLGEGSTLEYFPDHIIPHTRSALQQSLRLEMAAGSRAIVLDSMTSGRVAHGERWSFREIDSRTEVRVGGKTAFLNRTKISPASNNPRQLGRTEEFDYMTCLGLFAEESTDWPRVVAALQSELDRMPQVFGGVSLLSRNGCVARFLARSASDMICLNKTLGEAARELVLRMPSFDYRKY